MSPLCNIYSDRLSAASILSYPFRVFDGMCKPNVISWNSRSLVDIGLSNVYALARRWEEAKVMREVMGKRGVQKAPGCSEIEVGGSLNRFIIHDRTHPRTEEIYSILNLVAIEMKIASS